MAHPLDMVPVCPTCLEHYKRSNRFTRQLRISGCFDPGVHTTDPSQWPLAVLDEPSGLLLIQMSLLHHTIYQGICGEGGIH